MTPDPDVAQNPSSRDYPGFGRLGYFIGLIVISIISALFANGQARSGEPSLFPAIITLVGLFILSFIRLQNIGKNPWLALVTVIPLFNFFFVFLPCLVCQEGYEEDKTLDNIGRVLSALIVALFLLVILLVVWVYFTR